jgi:two-component system NtrC family sensor kinase
MVEDEALLRALRVLQESTAGVEGAGYYGALARGLARAFAMRYGMVAEVDPKRPGKAFPLAFWDSRSMTSLAPYELRGTPCAGVAGGEVCHYAEHVARLFPLDALLVDLRIESYIGVPVAGAAARCSGCWWRSTGRCRRGSGACRRCSRASRCGPAGTSSGRG